MPVPPASNELLTRETLADMSLLAELRKRAPADMRFSSPEEIELSLNTALHDVRAGDDVHLFGYGSLMWNPAFHYSDARPATIRGWHRRFCLSSTVGRGTPQEPGLMLGLDRGGACRGVLFRLAAASARDELRLVWRREMATGVYRARWVDAQFEGGRARAVTFVVNHTHPRYLRGLTMPEMVRFVRTGRGHLGSCEAYVDALLAQLAAMSVRDAGMERLRAALGKSAGGRSHQSVCAPD